MKQLNGIELDLFEGSFEDVLALQKALSDALREKGVNFSFSGLKVSEELLQTDLSSDNIGGIADMVLSVATDKAVRNALFALGARCRVVKDGRDANVTPAFFEVPENRKHYFPVMVEIAKVNLLPFFEGLDLGSLIPGALNEKGPK